MDMAQTRQDPRTISIPRADTILVVALKPLVVQSAVASFRRAVDKAIRPTGQESRHSSPS